MGAGQDYERHRAVFYDEGSTGLCHDTDHAEKSDQGGVMGVSVRGCKPLDNFKFLV